MAHPGPPPPTFWYPFDEAATAASATEELLSALDAAADAHASAADIARVGFEGVARQRFDRALDEALADLGRIRRLLAADLGALEDDVASARRRAADADDEQRRWSAAERRWRMGQGAAG